MDTLSILKLIIYIMVAFVLVIIAVWIYLNKDEIRSFINPHQWCLIQMIEADNNISSWLQKKNADLRFEFNKGLYNMFDQVDIKFEKDTNGKIIKKKLKGTSIYRSGRVASFMYIEGNENPIDLRHLQVTGNPQYQRDLKEMDISGMFQSEKSALEDFFSKYGVIIIIAGFVIVILILLFYKPQVIVQQPQPLP